MMKQQFFRRISTLLLALVLVWGLFPPMAAQAAPTQIAVTLDQEKITPFLGELTTLTATATPNAVDGGYAPGDLSWSWRSADIAIVTVTEGNTPTITVTPMAPGNTSVVATATLTLPGGATLSATAQCQVTVAYDPISGLALSTSTLFLAPGASQDIKATVHPASADPNAITWQTSTTAVAEVSPTAGHTVSVRAVAPGTAVITATSGAKSAVCTVTVPGIVLSNADAVSIYVGNNHQLGFATHGDIGTVVEWSSSRSDIAQVSSSGRILAQTPGTAIITATVKGTAYTASCTVTIRENTAGLIPASASAGQPLSFSGLMSQINDQCQTLLGANLSYVTGLGVSTSNGVLYYGYLSNEDTGYGVGSEPYYYRGVGLGDRTLDKVSFVPSLDFSGTTADIRYTGYATSGAYFQGIIRVSVERATAITYSIHGNAPARFQSADFNAICRARNGRDLNYVTFSLPQASRGTLYYNYSGNSLDPKVTDGARFYRSTSPQLDSVAFVPTQGFTGAVTIQYTGRDTQGSAFSGRVVVNVTASSSSTDGDLRYQSKRGQSVTFRPSDFNTLCQDFTGSTLHYVRFDLPPTNQGTLYYNYTSSGYYDSEVSSTRNYYRSRSPFLENITFVPQSGYTGVVNIPFTGWSVNEERFTGTLTIEMDTTSAGTISYATAKGRFIEFDEDDFDRLCRNQTGYALNYARFELPSSSRGTLYYNYQSSGNYDSRVTDSRSYYIDSSPYLARVAFVPTSSYTGLVSIPFTGVDVKGNRFSGTVAVTVGGSASSSGVITYQTDKNKVKTFDDADFNTVSLNQTGSTLKYVRFTLPAASQGTLYSRYSSGSSSNTTASSSMSYYRTATPYLDNIAFLPASTFAGTCRFAFTGYSESGASFSGTVEVVVGGGTASANRTVDYTTASATPLTLNDSEFNTLSRDETGSTLSYIRFTQLPTTTQGTLYYNYSSPSKYDSKVAVSRSYYRTSSPYLSSLCFVPADGFSGVASIPFTAYATNGDRFSGTMQVTVSPPGPTSAIHYTTQTAPVAFRLSDFQSACSARGGSATLKHVIFSLPSAQMGTLYTTYEAPFRYAGTVSPLLTYTVDNTRPISAISFVPKARYSGTVTIAYTGYDTAGKSYSGTVELAVRPSTASAHFTDVGKYSWAIPSIDYLYENKTVSGVSARQYGPAQPLKRGDYLLMLVGALKLPSTSSGPGFSDVSAGSYYGGAIATAKAYGLLHDSGTFFYPDRALTRQDAAVYLYGGLRAAGYTLPGVDLSKLAPFADRASIPAYAEAAMATLVELGLLSGDDRGRLNPSGALTRAEMAVILHNTMTL